MKLDLFLFNDIYPCKKRFFANEIRAVILLPSRSSISTKPVGNRYVCPCAIPFRRWRNRHCILFSSPLRRSMELSSGSVSLTSLCRTALGCSAHISLSRAMFSRVPSMVWLPMKMKEVIPDSFNSFLSSILMEGPFQPKDVNVRCVDKAVLSFAMGACKT